MTFSSQILCKTCANREVQYSLKGRNYTPELECDYDMAAFPQA